jgi:hypothetical protein
MKNKFLIYTRYFFKYICVYIYIYMYIYIYIHIYICIYTKYAYLRIENFWNDIEENIISGFLWQRQLYA